MTTERTPAEVRCNAELGPNQVESLVERLRDMSRRGYWPLLGDEAADTLEAARAVGIRQEQEIMDQQREIERLRAALRLAREGYASEEATGLPVLPQWRESTMARIDEALGA